MCAFSVYRIYLCTDRQYCLIFDYLLSMNESLTDTFTRDQFGKFVKAVRHSHTFRHKHKHRHQHTHIHTHTHPHHLSLSLYIYIYVYMYMFVCMHVFTNPAAVHSARAVENIDYISVQGQDHTTQRMSSI